MSEVSIKLEISSTLKAESTGFEELLGLPEVGNVKVSRLPVASFYDQLAKFKQNQRIQEFGQTMATCVVGWERSRMINSSLAKLGLDLPRGKRSVRQGVSLIDMSEDIQNSQVTPKGENRDGQ